MTLPNDNTKPTYLFSSLDDSELTFSGWVDHISGAVYKFAGATPEGTLRWAEKLDRLGYFQESPLWSVSPITYPAPQDTSKIDSNKSDAVNSPSHYTKGNIEAIEAIEAALGENVKYFYQGNILKYIWRNEHKNGLEDLKKAQWCMNRMLENLNEE